jgi:hypothetical protein
MPWDKVEDFPSIDNINTHKSGYFEYEKSDDRVMVKFRGLEKRLPKIFRRLPFQSRGCRAGVVLPN